MKVYPKALIKEAGLLGPDMRTIHVNIPAGHESEFAKAIANGGAAGLKGMADAGNKGISIGGVLEHLTGKRLLAPAVALGAMTAKAMYDDIKGNSRKRAVFEAMCWDPQFKDVEKTKLLEWYNTINRYSPTTALDKGAVKELLKQFVTFGHIDLQTIKTLAETEKAVANAKKDSDVIGKLWG